MQLKRNTRPSRCAPRSRRASRAIAAALLLPASLATTGCDESLLREFRAAATPQLEQGFTTIFAAIVSGVFSVVQPDGTIGSGSDTTGG